MKIWQISDLHFGYHNQQIIDDFCALVEKESPDVVLITGDITHRAKSKQYCMARKFIDSLPCKVVTIPGNHDIPLYKFWKRLVSPYKNYKKFINIDIETSYEDDEIRILGLSSVSQYSPKKGKIHQDQLVKIKQFFCNAKASKLKILMFHHNISQIEKLHKEMASSHELIEVAESVGVDLICTGHLHYSKLLNLDNQPIIAHVGSLSCNRINDQNNSFFKFDYDNRQIKVTNMIYNDMVFSSARTSLYNLV